jgi:hypothetical protein
MIVLIFLELSENHIEKEKDHYMIQLTLLFDLRNHLVHSGLTDVSLTDARVKNIINDFEVAVDRVYDRLGNCYDFKPNRDY